MRIFLKDLSGTKKNLKDQLITIK